ncbi:PREDICTED: uncharacterized protein LOC101296719 [Fragaria vesca subsp. vesca]
MRPLIDELKELWENRVPTFDWYSQTSFRMKATVVWTISDFPGYEMLSSQTTKGYMACPICLGDLNASWHAGKVCYLGSRTGLPEDHPWRFDVASFDGKQDDPDVLARNPKRPSRLENWTHKSIFFELPYWKKLRIRHCLDVMHIEKNVCNSIVGTVFGFKDKTKDIVKARKDLQLMNIRPHLWLTTSGSMPLAHYRINPANEKKVFKWFEAIKYPHVVIRPYLCPDVVEPLVAVSKFFQKLCARELEKSNVLRLKEDIVYIMCKLERIFPPSFFDIMIHLMIHLPEQAMVLVHNNILNFRQLGEYKKYVGNRGKLEGSIANTYLLNECVTYYDLCHSNTTEAESSTNVFNLSVVSKVVRSFGNLPNSNKLTKAELREAHWCVLDHCSEIDYYKKKHLEKIIARQPYRAEEMHKRTFPDYFLNWFTEVVNVMSHRNIWSASTLEGDAEGACDEEEAPEPYQEELSNYIPDTQTIRINNDPHYVHGNAFITIYGSQVPHVDNEEDEDENEDEEPHYEEDEEEDEDEEDDDTEDEDYDVNDV